MNLEENQVHCPYCAEPITLLLDASAGPQQYIEDCSVCCQPIRVSLTMDSAGELNELHVEQENS